MHSIKTGLNRDKPEEGLLLLVVQNEWRIFLPHKIIIWERFGQTRNQLLMNHFFRRKQRICLSSQRCDFFTSNPTGHNVLKVLQVSIYVAGQTMTSDSRGDMNPNRTNLSIPDPNHLDEGHGKWYVLLFEYEYSEAQLQCLWVQLQGSVGLIGSTFSEGVRWWCWRERSVSGIRLAFLSETNLSWSLSDFK